MSNGPTEAANNLTKQVKRVKRIIFGFTSFRNYRIRTLLYAGKPNWSNPTDYHNPLKSEEPIKGETETQVSRVEKMGSGQGNWRS